MKKIISFVLVLLMLCISACSTSKTNIIENKNDLANLIEKGYVLKQTTYLDNKWNAIYEKDENYKNAYKVELTMDQETFDKLFEFDQFDEDQLEQFNEIVTSIPDCKITPMSDILPDESELLSFVGKPFKELEEAGYEKTGHLFSDEGFRLYADGLFYSLNVKTDGDVTYENIDDYSENDIREFIITEIEITGLSSYVLD